jgi:hypothetical protein
MLESLDKGLTGNATQSWGIMIWGESKDGTGSTAAKASKGAKIEGNFDYAAFKALMGDLLLVFPEHSRPAEAIKGLQEELDGRDWSKAAEIVKELVEQVHEMNEEAKKDDQPGKDTEGTKQQNSAQSVAPSVTGKSAAPKATPPSTSKPWWYSRDPMGYWNSYPLVVKFENESGDPHSSSGAIATITDQHGTKRRFHYWFAKDGYEHSEFLKP